MEPDRKPKVSAVWDHFDLISANKVKCRICSAELSYINKSTSSMLRHHRAKHEEQEATNTPRINEATRKHLLDQAVLNFIIKECQPLSIVESEGFRELFQVIEPSYSLPTRQTVKEMVTQKYEEDPERVKMEIEKTVAVQCSLCSGVYKYHGNTSSMIRHFSTQHGAVVNQGNTNQVDQKQDPDEALVKMVVKESQPFSIVDALLLSDSVEQPKKRGRSDMWEHFNLITPDKVQCSVCSAELKYHGNTSSMIRHYSTKHGVVANQGKTSQDDRKRELDEALVNMLVKDSQPFSIVDDCGFKEFVALLDPTYTLPSQEILENMVIQRFKKQKTEVKDHAEGGDSDPDC